MKLIEMDLRSRSANAKQVNSHKSPFLTLELAYATISQTTLSPEDKRDAMRIVVQSPKYSYMYARDKNKGNKFPEGELAISKSAEYSLDYAKNIVKGKFKWGEDAIAKDAYYSLLYARDVIGKRFELGERAIAKSFHPAYLYARDVIKGRFKLGEEAIGNSRHKHKYTRLLQNLK